jgi:hypothetical protein
MAKAAVDGLKDMDADWSYRAGIQSDIPTLRFTQGFTQCFVQGTRELVEDFRTASRCYQFPHQQAVVRRQCFQQTGNGVRTHGQQFRP